MSYASLTKTECAGVVIYDADSGVFVWKRTAGKGVSRTEAGVTAGSTDRHGYVQIKLLGVTVPAHRLAWLMTYGDWPQRQIDHINGVRGDNRIANLREASASQNSANQKPRSTGSSSFKGVFWNAVSRKWQASVKLNGKSQHLGLFATEAEAADAYRKAAIKAHGDFARFE